MSKNVGIGKLLRQALAGVVLSGVACGTVLADTAIYVSPEGNDSWDGQAPAVSGNHGPVQTLQRAILAVRQLRAAYPGMNSPVHVVFAKGDYPLGAPVAMSTVDSGTPQSPTIYEAAQGEHVVISGAVHLDPGGWHRENCSVCGIHPEILTYQLPAGLLGKLGSIADDGAGKSEDQPGPGELFYDGTRMRLGRWPAQGYARIATLYGKGDTAFAVNGLPLGIEREQDLHASGYWLSEYSKGIVHLRSADSRTGQVVLAQPEGSAMIKNARFYIVNALAAVNAPGDWYLDRSTGKLYFWAPKGIDGHTVQLSVAPSLLTGQGVSNVQFLNLDFADTRATAISFRGADGIVFNHCVVVNTYGAAIRIEGRNSGILSTEFRDLGNGAVELTGGDRKTLTSSGMYIEGSSIHDIGYWHNGPGIQANGVGMVISNNTIVRFPQMAIAMTPGNDHLIERNMIGDEISETSDFGAIYSGRDWTARGTVIRQNYLFNIQGTDGRDLKGVYLDDELSGTTVTDNVFWNVQQPVFMSGGMDNIITRNIFISSSPSISIDQRGMNWQSKLAQDPNGQLRQELNAMPYTSELWRRKYPGLADTPQRGYGVPWGNQFLQNYFIGSMAYRLSLDNVVKGHQVVDNGVQIPLAAAGVGETPAPDFQSMCRYVLRINPSASICH